MTEYEYIGDTKKGIMKQLRRTMERQREIEHERQLAQIRSQSHALIWTGSRADLVAAIAGWYRSGWIVASSVEDALEKASIHFVRADGSLALHPEPPITSTQAIETTGLNIRQAFVVPLLEKRGWSPLDWANEAGVSHATAQDYLAMRTRPYNSTRMKLAKALGVPVQQLPR